MREVELKLLSELMKNSRRSDRELAKAIGSSQPTVSRIRKRLEKEGYIREYTMIPDFTKLGLGIMALTFSHFASPLSEEELEEVKEIYRKKTKNLREAEETARLQIILQEEGTGLGYSGLTVSFHKDYASFAEFMKLAEQNLHVELKDSVKPFPVLQIDKIENFLLNLKDETRYVPLTFANLAKYVAKLKGEGKG